MQAKPTPTGGAGATLTQVMSGQIDIGWSAPPVGLREVDAGQIRIVARGTDLAALAEQTTRVNIVNANYLAAHRDVVERFARAYRASLAWAYADPQAITWFAEGLGVDRGDRAAGAGRVLPCRGHAARHGARPRHHPAPGDRAETGAARHHARAGPGHGRYRRGAA